MSGLVFWLIAHCSSLIAVTSSGVPPVRSSRVPEGGSVPSVAVAADGTLHLAFGREGNAFYARSSDGGRSFSTAVQVNRSSEATVGGERGPKIALGRRGSLHLVWMAPRGRGLFYARAGGDGRFAPERNLLDPGTDADGADVAADGRGRIYIVWLDPRLPKDPESPVSKTIFVARSDDDGRTFGPNTPLPSDYPGRACACCALKAATDDAGRLLVGFRGAYHNLRNIYLVRGGRATLISDDGWKFEGCPMSGPFVQALEGATLVAWMSQGQVYFARESGARQAPSGTASARHYPLALRNQRGETLFAWVEGPKIRWEIRGPDGAPGERGETAAPAHPSRPAAFVAPDGAFTILD